MSGAGCAIVYVLLGQVTWREAFSQNVARIWRPTTKLLLQNLTDRQRSILVMTAHHRNDSTETLLLKLLRGVHSTNLVGMDIVTENQTTCCTSKVCRSKIDSNNYMS